MDSPIYKQYDRSGLDAQYNMRARHPEYEEYIRWWQEESRRARSALECRLDVGYGKGPLQNLDVFPASSPGAPVQMFIHGGFWQFLDKADFSFPAGPVVAAGGAFVSINYGLAPAVTLDGIVSQCREAVAWCVENAPSFQGDPDRLYVSGHSAGGHLTAMMLTTNWEEVEGLPGDPVKGGCAVSGVFDLEPIRLCYVNDGLGIDPESARRNSPLYRIPSRGAPLVAAVGGGETDEFHRHNGMLATAWRARGFPCEEITLPGLNHYQIVMELARPESPLTRAMLAQMGL